MPGLDDLLIAPFQLPFMAGALTVMLILGVAAGFLGVLVNLRGLEFLSDGLVHAVFPGVVIGFAVAGQGGLFLGGLVAAVIAAVVLTLVSRRQVPNDSAVAVVLTSMFSIGVIIVSLQSDYVGQLSSVLFGHILTITGAEIVTTAVVSAIALAIVAVTAKEQLLRAFDPQAADAMGYRPLGFDLALNVALALVVVAASQALGVLLVLALLIVPAGIARLLSQRLWLLAPIALVAIGLAGWLGLSISFAASVYGGVSMPGGATVVLTLLALFVLALAVYGIQSLLRSRVRLPRAQLSAGAR